MNSVVWLILLLVTIACAERAPWDQDVVVSKTLFNISLALAKNVDSLFHLNGSLEEGINHQSEIFTLRTALELPTANTSRPLGPRFRNNFGAPIANHAGCIPALEVVEIALELNASVYYFPTCTRLERCGGCCSHHLLTCKPTEIEEVELSVLMIDPVGGEDAMTVVNMTRHVGCKCACRIQESDCTPSQVYREDRCGCVCENKQICQQNMYWDSSSCQCRCKNADYCSTGFFNNATCECEKLQEVKPSTSRPPYRGRTRGKHRGGRVIGKGVKNDGTFRWDDRDSR